MSDQSAFGIDKPAGKPREPFFCLAHGAGGDLSSPDLKAVSVALAGEGHPSVRVNLPYRAAGRKSPPAAEKSVAGFTGTFETVRSQFEPRTRWVAGGRSLGGRVASMAAADGLEAVGLVFFPYPLHRPGDPSNPRIEHWPKITVPCLFIQGTKDPFCDLNVLEKSLPSLGAAHSLLLIQGGDHSLKVGGRNPSSPSARPRAEIIAEIVSGIREWAEHI